MVNAQLMFTIAQVSAAFVAIIAGFYTSKIITISSEKQRIRNKIAEIDAEIEQRTKIADKYQGKLDEVFSKWATDAVQDFTGDLLADESDLREYTLDELLVKFKEITNEEPDSYERAILTKERDKINERIRAELSERLPKNLPDSLSIALSSMPFSPLAERMRREGNRVMRVMPQVSEIESRRLDATIRDRDSEQKQISVLSSLKKHHEQELKSLAMPGNIGFGFASQIVFAIFGIAIPLYFATWPDAFDADADRTALIWFGLGITTVFAYIFSELVSAVRKDKPKKETRGVETAIAGSN